MIRITTLFAALCMAFATPAFADPASDALAGEQAAEATEATEAKKEGDEIGGLNIGKAQVVDENMGEENPVSASE